MIDPDAANVMFAWVEAAARGDLDAVIALPAQDVLDMFAETGDLDDPLVREAVAISLERRFGPIQAGELAVLSGNRLLGVDLECLVLITDPDLIGDEPVQITEATPLREDQGLLFTMRHTDRGWLVAGWGGSYEDEAGV